MAKLKAEGKIRHIGVSNFNASQMRRAQNVAPIASLQPPYSLLARDVETSILPFALEHHVGVIVYSPMASGLLTGAMTRERIAGLPEDDWRKHSPNFQEPQLSHNLELVETLRGIGKRHKATPGEVAIARRILCFPLPAIAVPASSLKRQAPDGDFETIRRHAGRREIGDLSAR